MRKILRVSPFAACFVVSTAAAQQGGWLIESSNIVSPAQPTTTVEAWAWFDDPSGRRNAFAVGDFDFHADNGDFLNPQVLIPWNASGTAPGGEPGQAQGNLVTGVRVFQLWGLVGIWGNTQNPILVWSVDWTTTDFTPRTVSLNTLNTTTFNIGTNSTHSGMNLLELYPKGFSPGTGMIEVVPSPASAMPMVVVGAMMLRRRRPG